MQQVDQTGYLGSAWQSTGQHWSSYTRYLSIPKLDQWRLAMVDYIVVLKIYYRIMSICLDIIYIISVL